MKTIDKMNISHVSFNLVDWRRKNKINEFGVVTVIVENETHQLIKWAKMILIELLISKTKPEEIVVDDGINKTIRFMCSRLMYTCIYSSWFCFSFSLYVFIVNGRARVTTTIWAIIPFSARKKSNRRIIVFV